MNIEVNEKELMALIHALETVDVYGKAENTCDVLIRRIEGAMVAQEDERDLEDVAVYA